MGGLPDQRWKLAAAYPISSPAYPLFTRSRLADPLSSQDAPLYAVPNKCLIPHAQHLPKPLSDRPGPHQAVTRGRSRGSSPCPQRNKQAADCRVDARSRGKPLPDCLLRPDSGPGRPALTINQELPLEAAHEWRLVRLFQPSRASRRALRHLLCYRFSAPTCSGCWCVQISSIFGPGYQRAFERQIELSA